MQSVIVHKCSAFLHCIIFKLFLWGVDVVLSKSVFVLRGSASKKHSTQRRRATQRYCAAAGIEGIRPLKTIFAVLSTPSLCLSVSQCWEFFQHDMVGVCHRQIGTGCLLGMVRHDMILAMRNFPKISALLVLLHLSACSDFFDSGDMVYSVPFDAEELVEVKSDVMTAQTTVENFMVQTKQGKNLSTVTIGLFMSNLLGQLGRHDAPLSTHLHQGDRFIEGYLTEVFQQNPVGEIEAIRAIKQPGNKPARAAAAAALECLRHIPDPKSPVSEQALDRDDLVGALTNLKQQLVALYSTLH